MADQITDCPHSVGERSYAAVEEKQCPICLRADRDRWRTAAENYQREAFNLSAEKERWKLKAFNLSPWPRYLGSK